MEDWQAEDITGTLVSDNATNNATCTGHFSRATLSQLSLDVFAIPAMAADSERGFSLATLTLTCQRLSMDPSALEKVPHLKNWIQRDAVTLGGLNFNKRGAIGEK